MSLNIPLARKVLEFVETEHEGFQHNQRIFFMTPGMWELWGLAHPSAITGEDRSVDRCGTTACIAGTACMLDPDTEVGISSDGVYIVNGKMAHWDRHAAKLLGLDDRQRADLFFTFNESVAIRMLRGYIETAEAKEFRG